MCLFNGDVEMKVMIIIGTRPEIIKMAPVLQELENRGHEVVFVYTGQHYSSEMSDIFFNDLELREPDYNLEVGSGTHAEQTAKMLVGVERVLLDMEEKPKYIIVQGDTNSTFAGALAAVKLLIPVVHVEAGLRSYDWRMPEEYNRIMIDHISSINFAPTSNDGNTLIEEQVHGLVYTVGNTVIDIIEKIAKDVERPEWLEKFGVSGEYALLTYHRAENLKSTEYLKEVIMELARLPIDIVFPIHPRTKKLLLTREFSSPSNVHLIEPRGYKQFISLLKYCKYVITDSGGIQEEVTAPSIQKRAYVLRRSTERTDACRSGHVLLLGENQKTYWFMIYEDQRQEKYFMPCPYGNGTASKQIVDVLEKTKL